jgi:hemerythrin
MAISWDPTLVLGIPEIDAQHQELFRRLDALLSAIRGGSSKAEVGNTLAFLGEYAVEHFSGEERIMEELLYPGLADHRAEHRIFAAEFRALLAEHHRDGPTASLVIRVNTQLTSWLRSHVYRTDRALADFLRSQPGGAPPASP